MLNETPPFEESVAAFLGFIRSEGLSSELVWVFSEDVTNCIRDYWIREPVPARNALLARDYFEYGRRQGRGVSIEMLCRVGGRTACYVWVPEDDAAASYAMQRPLGIKMPHDPVAATSVRSKLKWQFLKSYHRWRRCRRFAELLPARETATALVKSLSVESLPRPTPM